MNNRLKIVAIAAVSVATFAGASTAGASTHHKAKAKVHTVVKYIDVNSTPAACTAAITAYRTLGGQLATLAGNYASEYGPIATAVENEDATSLANITSQIQTWNGQLTTMVGQVTAANNEAAECEAG